MPSVGLVVHPDRQIAKVLAEQSRQWWQSRGFDVIEFDVSDSRPEDAEIANELAFIISLGGDGTMLRTVQLVIGQGVPVVGINLGNLGYLTQVEAVGIEDAYARLISGDFLLEERLALDVTIASPDDVVTNHLVLNEVVVERTEPGHTVHLDVSIADRPFLTYVADGLIVATPTGSTAYNLSLRGPVLSPTLRAMVLTPISAHMLFDRSLVLSPDEVVRLEVLDGRDATVVLDGFSSQPLEVGSVVSVRGGNHVARIVDFGTVHFHGVLRTKFGLADR